MLPKASEQVADALVIRTVSIRITARYSSTLRRMTNVKTEETKGKQLGLSASESVH